MADGRIPIDDPAWDLSTFLGRLKYFSWMTDYRTCLTSTEKLNNANELVQLYRFY